MGQPHGLAWVVVSGRSAGLKRLVYQLFVPWLKILGGVKRRGASSWLRRLCGGRRFVPQSLSVKAQKGGLAARSEE